MVELLNKNTNQNDDENRTYIKNCKTWLVVFVLTGGLNCIEEISELLEIERERAREKERAKISYISEEKMVGTRENGWISIWTKKGIMF